MPQKKVLIVDADAVSRKYVARILLEGGYEILEAGSGKEGLIFAWRNRPHLIIADPALTDLRGEELASKLRGDSRTAALPLIALSSDLDAARRTSCLQAGFNEYLVKSGQALPLLLEAVHRFVRLDEGMKGGGVLMVFLSAKGGTGTSSLCANIAMNIGESEPEARLAVADLVLPIGSIAPIVGYDGAVNIVTIAGMPPADTTVEFFRRELPEMGVWRFNLLAGSPDPELSNQLKVERIWDIVKTLKASYDYVLIDIGRSLSRITLPLIQQSNLVVLLINTDVSTVSLTKTLLDFLRDKGVHSDSIYAILNRAVGLEGLSKQDAEKLLDIRIHATIPYLGPNFAFANSHHQPFTLKFPNDTATLILRETAREMAALARKLRALG
jgi:pilus assembly protein CpaE